MKITNALIGATALFGVTNAYECWKDGGAKRCSDRDGMANLRAYVCENKLNVDGYYVQQAANGFRASVKTEGKFNDKQQCYSVMEDIINGCAGKKNGGWWQANGLYVEWNFCLDN